MVLRRSGTVRPGRLALFSLVARSSPGAYRSPVRADVSVDCKGFFGAEYFTMDKVFLQRLEHDRHIRKEEADRENPSWLSFPTEVWAPDPSPPDQLLTKFVHQNIP